MACFILVAGFGLTGAFAADPTTHVSPDFHTFSSEDGRTLKAQISSVVQDDVNLKRDDGRVFKIPMATLSKDDQNYIYQWVIKDVRARSGNILTFAVMTVKTEAKPDLSPAKTLHTSTWSEYYKIKATNQTQVNWTALHLRYIILGRTSVPGGLPPADYTPIHTIGTVSIDKLSGLQDQTVATNKIMLKEMSLPAGALYTNGAPAKTTDKVQGIWLRVYDANNNLLQEWASTKEIMQDNNWDAIWAPAVGGRAGANPFSNR